jgi:hypothetical protein
MLLVCLTGQTDGCTPLYIACDNDHVKVVRALLGAGAAVNQARVRGHGTGCMQSSFVEYVCVGVCVCARVCRYEGNFDRGSVCDETADISSSNVG